MQLAVARVDGEPVEGELDADEAVELQAPVVAQEGVEVAEEPVPLLLLHAESHERLAHAQGVELLRGDGAGLLLPRGEGALPGHEVGPVLAVEPLGDAVEEAAVGEGVELADRGGTGGLLPLQHPVEEEAERAAQERLERGGRDGPLRGHARKGREGPLAPEDAVGRVEPFVVAQGEDAGERELTPLLPGGRDLVRRGGAVEPLDLGDGVPGAEGGRGIARGLERGPAERLEVGNDRPLLAVGPAQRRAHLDEERRGLPVAPLQVGVGDGEGDARASRAHGAVERVELRRHPVGGEGDEGAGLLAHPVGKDRVLAHGRRKRSLGEPQDADRLELEAGGAGERAHVDGRLAEPDRGEAHRGDALLDDRECVGAAHAPGHLVGAGSVELVAEERMDRGAAAGVEDPLLQEVEEGGGDLGEGAVVDDEPGQRGEGGDGGLHRAEQVELVAEAPAVPLLLLGPERLERRGDLSLAGGKPLRPFERPFLARLVAAGGPDAPGDAHGLAGGDVLPVVHGGAKEGQDGGQALRGQEGAKRADEGEGASTAGRGGEGNAARHVDGELAARPGEPLDAARDERRERVRHGDEDGHLLERRLPLENLPGHPLGRGLHLGLHAGVLLEGDGAVRTLAARAGRVGEELRGGEEVADEEVALGGAGGGERGALEGRAGVPAEEGLEPVEVAGTEGASGDDARG